MAKRLRACVLSAAAGGLLAACSTPFDEAPSRTGAGGPASIPGASPPGSVYREADQPAPVEPAPLAPDAGPDDFVRYALYHSPRVEAAYQRWRAAAERAPQAGALPDPRLTVGFFLDEPETRVGAQQARAGIQQTFPWPGELQAREDAASRAAGAAWQQFEAERLALAERVVIALYDLAYLDAAARVTGENLDLLRSFEEVVRARYRVGAGSHPDLIRVQVELGQVEDRLTQLREMRPAGVADLNAALNRPASTEIPTLGRLPGRIAAADAEALADTAARANPAILALSERIEEQRRLTDAARRDGLPEITLGIDYTATADGMTAVAERGDDPVMVSLGLSLPIWRDKYDAGVRETLARRLAISHERADEANRLAAAVHRAWFDHTDADRRVGLYERTLIPKAGESLQASITGFRAGETDFLDVLDTERTLLEFTLAAERARADRAQALARLATLVGEPIHTVPADTDPADTDPEVNP
ncbi:MAG: TolC family protein [Phycisphaerales bacterium]|nr:TolC family protein [Phycisphaerales bacterium]